MGGWIDGSAPQLGDIVRRNHGMAIGIVNADESGKRYQTFYGQGRVLEREDARIQLYEIMVALKSYGNKRHTRKTHFTFPLCFIYCEICAVDVYQLNILRNNKPNSERADLQYKLYLYLLEVLLCKFSLCPCGKDSSAIGIGKFFNKEGLGEKLFVFGSLFTD